MNNFISKYIDKTIDIVKRALKSAHVTIEQVNRVILVGASTRLICVHEKLAKVFNNDIIHENVNSDEVVANGAVLYCQAWVNNPKEPFIKLGNCTIHFNRMFPYDVGIQYGDSVHYLVTKNSLITSSSYYLPLQVPRDFVREFSILLVKKDNQQITPVKTIVINSFPPHRRGSFIFLLILTVNEATSINVEVVNSITRHPFFPLTRISLE